MRRSSSLNDLIFLYLLRTHVFCVRSIGTRICRRDVGCTSFLRHACTDSSSHDERGRLLGRRNLSRSNSRNCKKQHYDCSPPRAQPPRRCRLRSTGCRAKQTSCIFVSLLRLALALATERYGIRVRYEMIASLGLPPVSTFLACLLTYC